MLNGLIFHFLCNIIIIKGGGKGGREGREGRMGEGVSEGGGGRERRKEKVLSIFFSLALFFLSLYPSPSISLQHPLSHFSLPPLPPPSPSMGEWVLEGGERRKRESVIYLSLFFSHSLFSFSLSLHLSLFQGVVTLILYDLEW